MVDFKSGRKLYQISHINSVSLKPSFVNFQSILSRAGGEMSPQAERLHILDIHDLPLLINEGNGKRERSIFHPERENFFPFINKKHPLILPQTFPEH